MHKNIKAIMANKPLIKRIAWHIHWMGHDVTDIGWKFYFREQYGRAKLLFLVGRELVGLSIWIG